MEMGRSSIAVRNHSRNALHSWVTFSMSSTRKLMAVLSTSATICGTSLWREGTKPSSPPPPPPPSLEAFPYRPQKMK
ncbi:hypothetical protein OIU84_015387 [Salix udensis]|uniref:Uncharacterized protein n=1 Tax=Salix udensis TaxID=889485 RepID=A0AAD6JG41_9ROSI|nr:hypothetical protein OIU84_015387 [Salix udensis]